MQLLLQFTDFFPAAVIS